MSICTSRSFVRSLSVAALLGTFLVGQAAQAQSDLLEEVIVTAQKREQSLQNVGISVTAFTGELLQDLGFTNTIQVAQQTPNLGVIQFHPTNTTVNIRGVSQNDFADHYESPIAIFTDGAYVAATGAVHSQMFDMERVEVLRGPQGTLFGRNATGGVIHYITAKPTEETSGYARLTVGNYETTQLEGAVNIPLSDTFQARISAARYKDDGIIENRLGDNQRETDNTSARLQLAWQASDNFDALLKLHYSKDDASGNAYQHDTTFANATGLGERVPDNVDFYGTGPGRDVTGYRDDDDDVWALEINEDTYFKREVSGGTLTLDWQISDTMTLTSITDYLDMDKEYLEDTDGSPNPFFNFGTTQKYEQKSQELRLAGESERSRWTAVVTGLI